MQIANPIYDVVFKYLLDDEKVAKLILSSITGFNIVDLDFKPTEYRTDIKESLTVFHLDFVAKIKDKNGDKKLIIIEIQKAKLPSDIMRFRRYLGEQYGNSKNSTTKVVDDKVEVKALPIVSIYFLGHKLKYTTSPIIKVHRIYTDIVSGNIIERSEEFIESLTHDSFIIQIPFLKSHKKSNLEIILSVFDQRNKASDEHILNILEEDYPLKYRGIIRRLLRAVSEPEIRKRMDVEDEVIRDIQNMERIIETKKKQIEIKDRLINNKEKEINLKEKVIHENEKVIHENEKVIHENEKVIHEKEREIDNQKEQINNTILELDKIGMPIDKISEITKLEIGKIKEIIKSKI